jgi:hypothetical protein
MLLMGLQDQYQRALKHVKGLNWARHVGKTSKSNKNLLTFRFRRNLCPFSKLLSGLRLNTGKKDMTSFQPFLRYFGGVLSAYALTKDPAFLDSADRLGKSLLPAFTTQSGLPAFAVSPGTGETRPGWMGGSSSLAEVGSCQMVCSCFDLLVTDYQLSP